MESLNDDLLIEKARAGDEQSLDILFDKYKHMVSKIARSYFLAGAEQEDLIQEAMIGLYKAYMNYNPNNNASFSTFAHLCITRNVQSAVKIANRKKNQILTNSISLSNKGSVTLHDENMGDVNIVIPSSSLQPDEQLIEKQNIQLLKEKIKTSLSNLEQKVLMLYLNGESYSQIAEKLNMTCKSVDNALSRVRSKLKFCKN